MTKTFEYHTIYGNTIPITLYGADKFGEQPCVIYIHGFKGFKDWGFVPYIGENMVENGYCFLTFNFSHNGIGKDMLNFTEPDKFEQNTFSLELSEANEIIDLCADGVFFGNENPHPVFLLGHSRGGGVAILAAATNLNVSTLATWASVYTFERFDKAEIQKWKQLGYIEVPNARTGQIFKMGLGTLNDILQHGSGKLSILNAAKNLNKPFLILHGDKDESVHFYEAEQLNLYSTPLLTEYELIKGANHVFGATHPFQGTTPELEKAIRITLEFFRKRLE